MKITEVLLAEHFVFHNLFDRLEQSLPQYKSLVEIQAVARLFESSLRDHSYVEDELLIEPLEPFLCQVGQSDNFHDEHEEIEAALAGVQATPDFAVASRLFLSAIHLARKHFDKEERIIFPLAERLLSPRTQAILGERWAAGRKNLVA
jgi:hemerythrin-like domain-containing protein